GPQRLGGHRHPLAVRARVNRVRYSPAGKNVHDLPHAKNGSAGRDDAAGPGLACRRAGKVTPVAWPGQASDSARKRGGNDPSDQMLARQEFSCVAAEIPELFGGPEVFMTGDLKDRITRRVQDRPPGGQMLGPELRDDFGAGRGAIAEDPLACVT